MLFGDDVLQVKGPFVRLFRQMAVFTSIAGTLPHEFPRL
jgi:hypothetical protein